MKNSELIKTILVNLAMTDDLPLDLNELDVSLFEFADKDEPKYQYEGVKELGETFYFQCPNCQQYNYPEEEYPEQLECESCFNTFKRIN